MSYSLGQSAVRVPLGKIKFLFPLGAAVICQLELSNYCSGSLANVDE